MYTKVILENQNEHLTYSELTTDEKVIADNFHIEGGNGEEDALEILIDVQSIFGLNSGKNKNNTPQVNVVRKNGNFGMVIAEYNNTGKYPLIIDDITATYEVNIGFNRIELFNRDLPLWDIGSQHESYGWGEVIVSYKNGLFIDEGCIHSGAVPYNISRYSVSKYSSIEFTLD